MQPAAGSLKQPSKNELARSCKNLACKTCMARACDMSLFLHDSCTILQDLAHILQEMVQDFARDAARIITCKFGVSCTISCKICARSCKIVQESCKKRDISHARVPCKSCMQDSCAILHDLASLVLLGSIYIPATLQHVPLPWDGDLMESSATASNYL